MEGNDYAEWLWEKYHSPAYLERRRRSEEKNQETKKDLFQKMKQIFSRRQR